MKNARRSLLHRLGRGPLVAASLGDYGRLLADARAAVRDGADVLEIRADCFPKAVLRPEPLRRILSKVRQTLRRPLLLTLRCRAEGGKLPRRFPEQDRLGLFRAALSEVSAVDIELNAEDIVHHVVFEAHKRGRVVIVSCHNFRKTPSLQGLRGIARRAKRLSADVLKIAATPRSPSDVEMLHDFGLRSGFRRRVIIAMGKHGLESRLKAGEWGSCLSYGYVRRRSAPGQLAVRELPHR